VARFEETMDGIGADARDRFYAGNYADMMGMPAPARSGGR